MIEWIQQVCLGGSLRLIEAILAGGPTLLVGLLIAAVFRFYLGPTGSSKLFGGDSLRALPQSWAVGMLLPVCSIGVLPILFEMRRCRIKPGAMTAFALSAPLFNPLSLLYGLTLSRPYVIIMFALGSLAVVTVVGLTWDSIARRTPDAEAPEEKDGTVIGTRRLFATGIYICRQLFGPAGAWAIVGASGMFLLAAVLPWGALQHQINRDDWWAPARMAVVAVPAYATPMFAMSQLGMMFQHANSPGAAFILLVVGAGLNIATLLWLASAYGARNVAIWFASLMIVVVGIAYAINKPLIPPGVDPSEHTHAFDVYTNPIHHLDSKSGDFAIEQLKKKIGLPEKITFVTIAVVAAFGLLFRLLGFSDDRLKSKVDESDLPTDPEQSIDSFDRIIGPQVVGATMLIGLVVLSVVMCYAYYPSPEECLEEVRFVRADTLSAALSGDADHALFWLPRWDEWSRRLEVGTFLRRGKITPYQQMQGQLIRKKLEVLEHELGHDHSDPDDMRQLVNDIMATDSRWVRAFRDTPNASGTSSSGPPQ